MTKHQVAGAWRWRAEDGGALLWGEGNERRKPVKPQMFDLTHQGVGRDASSISLSRSGKLGGTGHDSSAPGGLAEVRRKPHDVLTTCLALVSSASPPPPRTLCPWVIARQL